MTGRFDVTIEQALNEIDRLRAQITQLSENLEEMAQAAERNAAEFNRLRAQNAKLLGAGKRIIAAADSNDDDTGRRAIDAINHLRVTLSEFQEPSCEPQS